MSNQVWYFVQIVSKFVLFCKICKVHCKICKNWKSLLQNLPFWTAKSWAPYWLIIRCHTISIYIIAINNYLKIVILWMSNLDRFPSAAMYHEIWTYDPQKSREAQKGEVTRKICQKLLRYVTQPKNVVNNKYCHELSLVARPVSYQK